MIKAVQDWFEKDIVSTKHRKFFDANYDHTLHIKRAYIKNLCYRVFSEKMADVQPGWETIVLSGQTLDKRLEAEIKLAVDKTYTYSSLKSRIWKEQSGTDFAGKSQDVSIRATRDGSRGIKVTDGTDDDMLVEFDIGIIAKRTGRTKIVTTTLKNGTKRTSDTKVIIMAALRNMWGIMCNDVLKKESALAKDLRKAANDARQQMKKTHGETSLLEEGEKQYEAVLPEGQKSAGTAAILSIAKDWNKISSLAAAAGIKTAGGVLVDSSVIDETIKETMGALQLEYGIEDWIDSGTKEVRRDINIFMELNGPQSAMRKYDVDGIRAYLQSVRGDILKKIKKKKELQGIADLEGSPSGVRMMKRQAKKTVIIEMLGSLKKANPDLRLKVNKDLLKEAKAANKKTKRRSKAGGVLSKTGAVAVTSRMARRPSKGRKSKGAKSVTKAKTAQSPIALRNIINEWLPRAVAQNMGSPALNFRTGRFANSARVENLTLGPRGGLNIDYTYQLDPYQTFEPGFKQGSTQRDPRKLIGGTIRELAMNIIGRQPTTIRRT